MNERLSELEVTPKKVLRAAIGSLAIYTGLVFGSYGYDQLDPLDSEDKTELGIAEYLDGIAGDYGIDADVKIRCGAANWVLRATTGGFNREDSHAYVMPPNRSKVNILNMAYCEPVEITSSDAEIINTPVAELHQALADGEIDLDAFDDITAEMEEAFQKLDILHAQFHELTHVIGVSDEPCAEMFAMMTLARLLQEALGSESDNLKDIASSIESAAGASDEYDAKLCDPSIISHIDFEPRFTD